MLRLQVGDGNIGAQGISGSSYSEFDAAYPNLQPPTQMLRFLIVARSLLDAVVLARADGNPGEVSRLLAKAGVFLEGWGTDAGVPFDRPDYQNLDAQTLALSAAAVPWPPLNDVNELEQAALLRALAASKAPNESQPCSEESPIVESRGEAQNQRGTRERRTLFEPLGFGQIQHPVKTLRSRDLFFAERAAEGVASWQADLHFALENLDTDAGRVLAYAYLSRHYAETDAAENTGQYLLHAVFAVLHAYNVAREAEALTPGRPLAQGVQARALKPLRSLPGIDTEIERMYLVVTLWRRIRPPQRLLQGDELPLELSRLADWILQVPAN
jgi:hypothetical protein